MSIYELPKEQFDELMNDLDVLFKMQKQFDDEPYVPLVDDCGSLIEQLSFTKTDLGLIDAGEMKIAWTRFLNKVDSSYPFEKGTVEWDKEDLFSPCWPLNEGLAEWYSQNKKDFHAIAVYEHLYTLLRRRELSPDDGVDKKTREAWLCNLVRLYSKNQQPVRAIQLAGVIEDYCFDGDVSLDGYAEIMHFIPEQEISMTVKRWKEDKVETEKQLKIERGSLLNKLHDTTNKYMVEAELWSFRHWQIINPRNALGNLALAIECEFDHKIFLPNEKSIRSFLGEHAPKPRKNCSLGNILSVMKECSNVGIRCVLAKTRDEEFLTSQDTIEKLTKVWNYRNRISHPGQPITKDEYGAFLKEIKEGDWVFKFLEALQPKNPA